MSNNDDFRQMLVDGIRENFQAIVLRDTGKTVEEWGSPAEAADWLFLAQMGFPRPQN